MTALITHPTPVSPTSPTDSLHGQVSLITGAARGIGAAIARTLAARGSDIVIVDVIDGSDTVAALLADYPERRIHSLVVDVKDRTQVHDAVEWTVTNCGRIDTVVNNAGTCGRVGLEDMTDDMWERDLDTNLRGTFLFTQAAVYPHMRDQGSGSIVNISSISGIMGGPMSHGKDAARSGPAYAASKGGIIALTKWVAKEVGPLGITCNSVAPGPIATPMTQALQYDLSGQAIQRMGSPEDIASAVAYLASPGARYVTGDVLKVCGGSAIG